jgi:hypothetical protein
MGVEGVEVVWVYGLMDKYVDLWTCICIHGYTGTYV